MEKETWLEINHYPYRIIETGTGFPFVWLHGMFHSPAIEDVFSVIDFGRLSSFFRIIRIELPAHGMSPVVDSEDRMSWPNLAEDIKQLMSQIHGGEYIIGGFSQGAGIAAHTSVRDHLVRGLVMTMLPRVWELRDSQRKTYWKLIRTLESSSEMYVLTRLFKMTKYPPDHLGWSEEMSEAIVRLMLLPQPNTFPVILKGAILSDLPDRGEIMGTGVPVILAGWEDDMNHPACVFHEMESNLNPVYSLLLRQKSDIEKLSSAINAYFYKKL